MNRSGFYRRNAVVKGPRCKLDGTKYNADPVQMSSIDNLALAARSLERESATTAELGYTHFRSEEDDGRRKMSTTTTKEIPETFSSGSSGPEEDDLLIVYEMVNEDPLPDGMPPQEALSCENDSSRMNFPAKLFPLAIQLAHDDLLMQVFNSIGSCRPCPVCTTSKYVNEMVFCINCSAMQCKYCFVKGCPCDENLAGDGYTNFISANNTATSDTGNYVTTRIIEKKTVLEDIVVDLVMQILQP